MYVDGAFYLPISIPAGSLELFCADEGRGLFYTMNNHED
jgi:hypothetical protein